MARPLKDVACMFCGNAPCSCNAKPKAEPKKRAPRKAAEKTAGPIVKSLGAAPGVPPSAPGKKAALTDAMRAAATSQHQGAATVMAAEAVDEITAILSDPEFVDAIKALKPLMHHNEQRRFAKILAAPSRSVKERADAWKKRRIVNE
jgi:hypothetical protein